MSGVIQMVSRLVHVNGLPQDTFENVVHLGVSGSDPAGADITDALNAFRDFYTVDVGAMAGPLDGWISEVVSRAANACSVLAYFTNDLTGATPFGSPIGQVNFTLAAPGSSTQLPEEVAVVLSVNGDLTDIPVTESNPSPPPLVIRPQQRRRGRLFFGPLTQGAGFEVSSSYRPSSVLRTDLGLSIKAMYNAIVTNTPWVLGVWSKADAEVHPIVAGYVDDAWDTQRRRGLEPTTRTAFTI